MRSRIDGRRRGRFLFHVGSLGTGAGGAENLIEERHRWLRLHGIELAHLQVISDFCDERDETLPAVVWEPDQAEGGASGKHGAEKLLGFGGSTGRRQAFDKHALSP